MDELSGLGLSEYEKRAYLALLKSGPMTGGNASKASAVPQGRVYQTLSSLELKGLIRSGKIRPKVFSALEPEEAVSAYVSRRKQELARLEEEVVPRLKRLKAEKGSDALSERITVLTGICQQWDLVELLWNTAEKSMKHMFTYEERPDRITKATYGCIGRGADVRILATKMTKKGLQMMREDVSHGAKVRYYPVQELRLSIKDHKEARLHLRNPKNSDDRITAHIQSAELAKALEHYFDAIWEKAKVIK